MQAPGKIPMFLTMMFLPGKPSPGGHKQRGGRGSSQSDNSRSSGGKRQTGKMVAEDDPRVE